MGSAGVSTAKVVPPPGGLRPHLFALESHNLVTLLIVWPYFVESNRNSRLILGKAVALGLGDGVSNQIS